MTFSGNIHYVKLDGYVCRINQYEDFMNKMTSLTSFEEIYAFSKGALTDISSHIFHI